MVELVVQLQFCLSRMFPQFWLLEFLLVFVQVVAQHELGGFCCRMVAILSGAYWPQGIWPQSSRMQVNHDRFLQASACPVVSAPFFFFEIYCASLFVLRCPFLLPSKQHTCIRMYESKFVCPSLSLSLVPSKQCTCIRMYETQTLTCNVVL